MYGDTLLNSLFLTFTDRGKTKKKEERRKMANNIDSNQVQSVIEDISSFEQTGLRHVDQINEKNQLPSKEGKLHDKNRLKVHLENKVKSFCQDIELEKQRLNFMTDVEGFDANKLKKIQTVEKIVLPDKEGKRRDRRTKV
jgi:hypothetical protein